MPAPSSAAPAATLPPVLAALAAPPHAEAVAEGGGAGQLHQHELMRTQMLARREQLRELLATALDDDDAPAVAEPMAEPLAPRCRVPGRRCDAGNCASLAWTTTFSTLRETSFYEPVALQGAVAAPRDAFARRTRSPLSLAPTATAQPRHPRAPRPRNPGGPRPPRLGRPAVRRVAPRLRRRFF